MKKNSLYLIIAPFLLWLLNELYIFKPSLFFVSLSFGLLVIAFFVRLIVKNNSKRFWPLFILTPALFYLSLSFYSAIITGQFWIQLIFIFNALFVYSYLKNIYYHFSFGAPEREIKLRRLLLSGSFLTAFALAATLYGLPIFLNWSFFYLLLIFIVFSIALFSQFLIFHKDLDKTSFMFLGIDTVVLGEFAAVIFLLPLNYNILGLLVAIVYYLLILFNNWRIEDRLVFKHLRWPIAIAGFIFIIILLSARWL